MQLLALLVYERSNTGDLVNARAHADHAIRRIRDGRAANDIAGLLIVLGEAEFSAGQVERALELAGEATVAARQEWSCRQLPAALLNLAAYCIAVNRWDEARAASVEVLGLAQETQRLSWRAWAMQHLAAVAVLSADLAAPDRLRVGDAARVVGYVDGRIATLNSPREYTEEQEYDRIRAALLALFGEAETARLLAEGESLDDDRAAALAQSL